MFEKVKTYLQHKDENKKYNSFFDEMNRYKQIDKKIVIHQNKDIAFLSCLKVILQKTNYKNLIGEIQENDLIVFKKTTHNPLNWKVLVIDYDNLEFMIESRISNDNKIWIGIKFVKENNNNSVFIYCEGYMSAKLNGGLPKTFLDLQTKKAMKVKCLKLENKINNLLQWKENNEI